MTQEENGWKLIPEEILQDYFDFRPKSNIVCGCGFINYQIEGIPYAWDEYNHDMIYAHKCEKCSNIIYTRD